MRVRDFAVSVTNDPRVNRPVLLVFGGETHREQCSLELPLNEAKELAKILAKKLSALPQQKPDQP